MKIKIRRFFCVILSCAIILQSFALSYRKAKATELIIGGELAAEAAGAAGLTLGTGGVGLLLLLGGLGIAVAWENREEIKDTVVATGEKVQKDFENFCDKAGTTIQSAQAEYDDFMDKLSKGICDTSSKFYDMFKQFVGDISKQGDKAEDGGLHDGENYEYNGSTGIVLGAGTHFIGKRFAYTSSEYDLILTVGNEGKCGICGDVTNGYIFLKPFVNYEVKYRFEGLHTCVDGKVKPLRELEAGISRYTSYGMHTVYPYWCVIDHVTGILGDGNISVPDNYDGYTFPQTHPNYGNTSTWDVSDTDPFGISRPHDGIGRDIPITKPIEDVPDKPVLNPETGQYEWTNTWNKVISGDIPIGDLIDVGVVELPDEADDTPGKLWVNGEEMDIPIEDVLPIPRETVEPTKEPNPTEEPDEETKKIRNKMVRPNLKSLFPFCIPFDLYRILSLLDAEPKAPEFSWNFIVGFNGGKPRYQTVRFRFNDFDSVAKVLRNMEKILFIVGLMMITRDKMLKS